MSAVQKGRTVLASSPGQAAHSSSRLLVVGSMGEAQAIDRLSEGVEGTINCKRKMKGASEYLRGGGQCAAAGR